jgi:hypothetical protein
MYVAIKNRVEDVKKGPILLSVEVDYDKKLNIPIQLNVKR